MTFGMFLLGVLVAYIAIMFVHYGSKWIHKSTGGDKEIELDRLAKEIKAKGETIRGGYRPTSTRPVGPPPTGRSSVSRPNSATALPRSYPTKPQKVEGYRENPYEEAERRRQNANIQAQGAHPTLLPTNDLTWMLMADSVMDDKKDCAPETYKPSEPSNVCREPDSSPSYNNDSYSSSSSDYSSSPSSDSGSSDSGSSSYSD